MREALWLRRQRGLRGLALTAESLLRARPFCYSLAVLGTLFMVLLASSGAIAAKVTGPTTVRPNPLQTVVAVGETVTVTLFVQDVANLYGADIRLSFDPAVLEVQDAQPGVPGVQILPLSTFLKPDFVLRKKACNVVDPSDPDCQEAGKVWYVVTQTSPSSPVSGSGPLAAVQFKRLQPGLTTLTIATYALADRTGMLIPAIAQDGTLDSPVMSHATYLPLVGK